MSKQFVEPLVAENAKLKEIIESQQKMIDAKIAMLQEDDNGAKIQWNEEDGGFEDICGDCNKPWCEGGEYGEDEQWFCKDCYVEPDYEHNVDYCDSCYQLNRHREPPYALCYKCEEKEKENENVTANIYCLNIMDAFKQFLGNKYRVIIQPKEEGYTCDFVIIQGACPMRYDKKLGWVNCNECILNYDCEHGGTKEFRNLLKLHKCKGDWLEGGVFGVWIKK